MDNNIIISIQELLKGRNAEFDKAEKVKLVRHKNDKNEHHYQGKTYSGSLIQMYRYDYQEFIDYQNEQDLKTSKMSTTLFHSSEKKVLKQGLLEYLKVAKNL